MAETSDKPTKTLIELAEILGPPDPALLASLMTTDAIAAYQEQGRSIASSHVLVDAERLYGLAYATWIAATEAQQALLVGFSEGLLAVGVHQAVALRAATASADADGHSDKTARKVSETGTAAASAKALALRDQGEVVLKTIAGHDALLKTRIAAAVGTADTPDNLAKGTERVAALGKELVASTEPAIAALVTHTRATARYFDQLEAAAADLRSAVERARPRLTATKISQGEIDVLDGVVLRVLSDIIHAFAAAQDIDGTIPTLAPLATRRVLGSRNKRKPKPDPDPKPQ